MGIATLVNLIIEVSSAFSVRVIILSGWNNWTSPITRTTTLMENWWTLDPIVIYFYLANEAQARAFSNPALYIPTRSDGVQETLARVRTSLNLVHARPLIRIRLTVVPFPSNCHSVVELIRQNIVRLLIVFVCCLCAHQGLGGERTRRRVSLRWGHSQWSDQRSFIDQDTQGKIQ